MNLYESIKARVSVPEAARFYGLEAGRNNMVCCPFHADRHPSMKLNEAYYYCFGCGAHGDVIDLTARLFSLSQADAARKLAADFNLASDTRPVLVQCQVPYNKTREFRERENRCFRCLRDYLHLLWDWKERYDPKSPDEQPDDRYVEACLMSDPVEYLLDSLLCGSDQERLSTMEMLETDGVMDRLVSYVERRKLQEDCYVQNRSPVV